MREGDRFDNYVLRERIAQGGMAEIYRALRVGSLDISREVCIKCIRPALSADGDFVRMFTDEARIASTLRHGNIVAVDHFGAVESSLFMCTEWVHGTDARKLLEAVTARGEAMPLDAALFIVAEVLKALEYAHGKISGGAWLQIVHRDVSPHNVMVSYSGEVKLTDFGVAKATSRLHRTRGEMIKGKLAYMAPEQAVGGALDHRTDLFAIGVVTYELITGRRPFRGETEIEGVQRMLRGERLPLSAHRDDLPPELEDFVSVLLSQRPEDRFTDAGVALDALSCIPGLRTGSRTLQRLLRELFAGEPFSTLPPRLALTLTPPLPSRAPSALPITGTEATELAEPFARPAPARVRPAGTLPTLLVRPRRPASAAAASPADPTVPTAVMKPTRGSSYLAVVLASLLALALVAIGVVMTKPGGP